MGLNSHTIRGASDRLVHPLGLEEMSWTSLSAHVCHACVGGSGGANVSQGVSAGLPGVNSQSCPAGGRLNGKEKVVHCCLGLPTQAVGLVMFVLTAQPLSSLEVK